MKPSKFASLLSECVDNKKYISVSNLPAFNLEQLFIVRKLDENLPMFDDFLEFSKKDYYRSYHSKKIHNYFSDTANRADLNLFKILNIAIEYSYQQKPRTYIHGQMHFLVKYLYFLYSHKVLLFPFLSKLYFDNLPINTKLPYIVHNNKNSILEKFNLQFGDIDTNLKSALYRTLLCVNLDRHKETNDEIILKVSQLYKGNNVLSMAKALKNFFILEGHENLKIEKQNNDLHIKLSLKEGSEAIKILESLPIMNTSLSFMVTPDISSKEKVLKEWSKFNEVFEEIEKKSVEKYIGKCTFFDINKFQNIEHLINYYLYIRTINENKSSLIIHLNLIYRFLIYLVANAKLLFPANPNNYLTTSTLKFRIKYYQTNKVCNLYKEIDNIKAFNNKGDYSPSTSEDERRKILQLFGSVNPFRFEEIDATTLEEYERTVICTKYYKRDSSAIATTRTFFKYLKNNVNMKFLVNASTIRYDRSSKTLDQQRRTNNFLWIDSNKSNYKFMQDIASWYINFRIKKERKAKGTINGNICSINKYLDWLFDKYPNEEYNAELIYSTFDYLDNESASYPKYLLTKGEKASTLEKSINTPIRMLKIASNKKFKTITGCIDELSGFAVHQQVGLSARKKMGTILYLKMIDIFSNRPPKYYSSASKVDKGKCDISWWKHDVYPAFPIAIILMLLAAQRSANALNICREKSFIFKNNKLEKIIINTDKSTNRKKMPEIPNSWEYFDHVLVPFIKWHKEYFTDMKEIVYKDDENSPWEKYTPLFNLPSSDYPMGRESLMAYWKRGLAQAQLELQQEGMEYKLIWNKDNGTFLKNIYEIENSTVKYFKNEVSINYDLHSIRGSALTFYHAKGLSPMALIALTGHSSIGMIYKAYLDADPDELRAQLQNISKDYDFYKLDNITTSSNKMIKEEFNFIFLKHNNSHEELQAFLSSKGLFFLNRSLDGTYKQNTSFVRSHPATWKGMLVGICPGATCPNGNTKCSLCPYLLTGFLFLRGIVFELNRLFILFNKIQSELVEYRQNGGEAEARSLSEDYENILIEIIGWADVLETISKNNSNDINISKKSEHSLEMIHSFISIEPRDKNLGILDYLSEASKLKNLPIDSYIRHYTTKLALIYSKNNNNLNQIMDIIDDDKKVIAYIIDEYDNAMSAPNLINDFLSKLRNGNDTIQLSK